MEIGETHREQDGTTLIELAAADAAELAAGREEEPDVPTSTARHLSAPMAATGGPIRRGEVAKKRATELLLVPPKAAAWACWLADVVSARRVSGSARPTQFVS